MRVKGAVFVYLAFAGLSLSNALKVLRGPTARLTNLGASLAADEASEPSTQEKWERWMRSGRRQGTSHNDIVMREKEEFGGIPRMERWVGSAVGSVASLMMVMSGERVVVVVVSARV